MSSVNEPMPMAPAARQRQRISQQAAEHAQQVLDLHDANEQLIQQYNAALSRIALLESHVAQLKCEVENLTFERDDFKHKYSEIDISLRNAGAILCHLLTIPRPVENREPQPGDERVGDAIRELERTLTAEKADANSS